MKFFATQKAAVSWGVFLVALLGVLLPNLALAQSASGGGPFTVSSSDLSKQVFLDYLFGPLTGAGNSPLTTVVSVLNSAVLFLGGVFMAYTIIAGTMSTAHDGEMLGKKWSSLWLPIRTTLGAAAVMPVIGGGWCAAQAVVVWLASLGIGIANAMWGAYIQNGNVLANAMYNPPNMSAQVSQLFENLLLSNVCIESLKAEGNAINASGSSAVALKLATDPGAVTYNSAQDSNGVVTMWFGTADDPSYCGSFSFPTAVAGANSGSGASGTSGTTYVSATGQALLNMPQVNSQLLPLQNQTIVNAQGQLAALAQQIVSSGGAGNDQALQQTVTSTIQSLTLNYTAAIKAQAQAVYASAVNNSFLTTMKKDGWVMAGAFYMEISRAQDQISQAITTLPTSASSWSSILTTDIANGGSSWWQRLWGEAPSQDLINSLGRATKMTQAANQQISGGVASITNSNNLQGAEDAKSFGDRMVSAFTSSRSDGDMFTGGSATGSGVTQNPVIMAKNMGNSMVSWAWSAFGVAVGLGAAGFIPGVGSGIAAIMSVIAGPFTLLFSSLLVSGSTLAYYIPMVPYILWMGVVLGWAVLLIEAVVAAPLWAVVHMAPDADGIVGRGGQGYMLVLSLTLRPALMVVGLVAAISLMTPIGYLINSTFGGAFMLAQGPGAAGLTAMVAGCIIYAGLMISVINKIFGLIHVVPDRLLRWIGGDTGGLGETASAVEQGAGGKMIAGIQAARGLSEQGQGMLAGGRQAMATARAAKEAEQGQLAQKLGNSGDRVRNASENASDALDAAQSSSAGGSGDSVQYDHAMTAARTARSESVQGAVEQANLVRAGGGPGAAEASGFLDRYAQAAAASKTQPGAMSDFISGEAERAKDAQRDVSNPVQPFHTSMIRAQENQDRLVKAQEGFAHASNADIQSVKDAQRDDLGADDVPDRPPS